MHDKRRVPAASRAPFLRWRVGDVAEGVAQVARGCHGKDGISHPRVYVTSVRSDVTAQLSWSLITMV